MRRTATGLVLSGALLMSACGPESSNPEPWVISAAEAKEAGKHFLRDFDRSAGQALTFDGGDTTAAIPAVYNHYMPPNRVGYEDVLIGDSEEVTDAPQPAYIGTLACRRIPLPVPGASVDVLANYPGASIDSNPGETAVKICARWPVAVGIVLTENQ